MAQRIPEQRLKAEISVKEVAAGCLELSIIRSEEHYACNGDEGVRVWERPETNKCLDVLLDGVI
jgi:hypothetical protein